MDKRSNQHTISNSNTMHTTITPVKQPIALALSGMLMLGAHALTSSPAQAEVPAEVMATQSTLAPLVERVTPAVVNVSVKSEADQMAQNPLFDDEFFRHFFEDMPDGPMQPREREAQSVGSGVIVDAENGYILTNNHVIETADEIQVRLKDGREIKAELIGADEGTDIAVLQIEADDLVELPIGTPNKARIGDFVIAVGNPFGIGQTVTSGIISALGRTGLNVEGYESFIQTDASINPGNSGGALVGMDGKLLGINTAIIAPARGNVGIGFAVPADMAQSVMEQLIEYGEVKRGQIGVVIQDLTLELAEALQIDADRGALISEVVEGSPADEAGLESGDVIISAGGERVKNLSDLRNQVGLVRLGESLEVTYLRDGEEATVTLTVDNVSFAGNNGSIEALEGASLTTNDDNQVVVESIEAGSLAARYGLNDGDIILEVNRTPIDSIADLAKIMQNESSVYALLIQRNNNQQFIIIRP